MRPSSRQPDELRAISLERGVVKYAEGSCFVKFGDTHVLVTATLEDRLPPWLKGQARGWITAEYGMLPRATLERTRREATAGKQGGRTVEIQRLIGRSLRAVVDLEALRERQITTDCEVIQPAGGPRAPAIRGAWVALHDCLATHAPVMPAVRVPPSAWITSQSMVICRSPSATRSTTARRLRPMSRWISIVRPFCLPAAASRRVRSRVARGNMPYSAVIQPRAWPLSQGGRRSSSVAVTRTWGSPNFTKHEPSAYFTTPRSSETARSSSVWRRLGRIGSLPAASESDESCAAPRLLCSSAVLDKSYGAKMRTAPTLEHAVRYGQITGPRQSFDDEVRVPRRPHWIQRNKPRPAQ